MNYKAGELLSVVPSAPSSCLQAASSEVTTGANLIHPLHSSRGKEMVHTLRKVVGGSGGYTGVHGHLSESLQRAGDFSGELGSAGLTGGFNDLKGLFWPKQFWDSNMCLWRYSELSWPRPRATQGNFGARPALSRTLDLKSLTTWFFCVFQSESRKA